MKSVKKSQNDFLPCLLAAAMIVGILCLQSGCVSTVTPTVVKSTTASWDGAEQNSGLLGWTTNGLAIITPHARDRYNALVGEYGKQFAPTLVWNYGIGTTSSNAFTITPEALADFARMNRWRKAGKTF